MSRLVGYTWVNECGLLLVSARMGVFGKYEDHSSLNGNKCNYPTFLDMLPGFDGRKFNFVPLVWNSPDLKVLQLTLTYLNDEKCVSALQQEAVDETGRFSVVTSSGSTDDISGVWTYEWSLVRSPGLELHTCDTDLQSRWWKPCSSSQIIVVSLSVFRAVTTFVKC